MRQPEHALTLPARMVRIAIVAPRARLRETLVELADSGTVELAGTLPTAGGEALEALRRLEREGTNGSAGPVLAPARPDVPGLERAGAVDLLRGEVELERRSATAVEHGSFAGLLGWAPQDELEGLAERLAGAGAGVIELPAPPWLEPPALIARKPVTRPFRPLVETYGPARYADLDPTLFAAFSFVLMFGMMFGDVGHGLLLAAAALALRFVKRGRLLAVRRVWPLPFAAGLSAAFFGLLYGECFGPTGLVPTLWLDPVDEAPELLAAAVAVGAVLLAQSYAFGTVNRWREQGPAAALVAPSGIAGTCIFLGGGIAAAGWYLDSPAPATIGAAIAVAGLALMAIGYAAHAARGSLGALEVLVELVDSVVRIGASAISFTRLAAFGLMHAALGMVVWAAASAAWGTAAGAALAILVLLVGNVLAFTLELLVAGVQALRLEYYELFSRIFAGEGHPYSPWHIPLVTKEEP
ncbi:MAG TPA: V-type ATPase 116kDa subunit family protein [Gaiellaceae bacterium]|nr:V-type ATPase 116kDa subunit family protein [Gaiellaceae bacterium]